MSKHTPGPWFFEVRNDDPYSDNHIVVGRIGSDGFPETHCTVRAGCEEVLEAGSMEANARLIAAAPELLAALKAAQKRLCEHCPSDTSGERVGEHTDECLAAQDAIEKAEGK